MTCTVHNPEWNPLQSDWFTGTATLNVSIDAQTVAVSVDSGTTFLDAAWVGDPGLTRAWQVYLTPDLIPAGLTYQVIVRVGDNSGPEPVSVFLDAGTITFAASSGGPSGSSSGDGGAGGSGVTDGVGAGFTGGAGVSVPLDRSFGYIPFIAIDVPPRAPQRDDLMAIRADDHTFIDVVRSGLYDVSLNLPISLNSLAFVDEPSTNPVHLIGDVYFEINGFDIGEPPINLYNNRAEWVFSEAPSGGLFSPALIVAAFPAVLLAGDTIQVALSATQISGNFPPDLVTGALGTHPDITMFLTYRGPVDL